MKVYIVTFNDYEQHDIRKVFLDEQKAREYSDAENKRLEKDNIFGSGNFDVEDYEVEQEVFYVLVYMDEQYGDKVVGVFSTDELAKAVKMRIGGEENWLHTVQEFVLDETEDAHPG